MAGFEPIGLLVMSQMRPCANNCQFCLLLERKTHKISVDRFVQTVEGFLAFAADRPLTVKQWFGNSYNFKIKEFKKLYDLFDKNGRGVKGAQNLHYLMLGGLPFMSEGLARAWLRERKAIGCRNVSGTYAGPPALHDRLFSKKGHFDFQIGLQKIAAEEGFGLMEKVILFKANLKDLLSIDERLAQAGPCGELHYVLPSYSGRARAFEAERPELDDILALPPRAYDLVKVGLGRWKTEKQWAERIAAAQEESYKDWLTLRLTEGNEGEIAEKGCLKIIGELTDRTAAAYARLPGPSALAEEYGDFASQRLYRTRFDAESLWLDRFLAANPAVQPGPLSRFNW
jgi:hypothetical protein